MSDFSIELAAERIVDSRTRRYFSEVLGTYSAGYYRSAVVMLWSVIVTDILFKLDQLSNAYGDHTAKSLLEEIDRSRRDNPRSPEWETELLEKLAARTDLLDAAELSFLQAIQQHRHLSAHPVLTQNDALFSPNKETTRAHIRNALESLLTKPPIMSKKVFDAFVEDIEQVSRVNPGRQALKQFLQAKYFTHFSLPTAVAIFRGLWRIVFKSNDARCEANRSINGLTLPILMGHWKSELLQAVSDDSTWFSDVSFGKSQLEEMMKIFSEYPKAFNLLTDAAKAPIRGHANKALDYFASCLFLSPSPEDHFEEIRRRLQEGDEDCKSDLSSRTAKPRRPQPSLLTRNGFSCVLGLTKSLPRHRR